MSIGNRRKETRKEFARTHDNNVGLVQRPTQALTETTKGTGVRMMDTLNVMQTRNARQEEVMRAAATKESAAGGRMTRELTPEQRRAIEMRRQQILLAQRNRRIKVEREQARLNWERGVNADSSEPSPKAPIRSVEEPTPSDSMFSLRKIQGEVLRELRTSDHKTLREVSQKAGVSLGYLSEVERGQKEASSELLVSITQALGVKLSEVLTMIAERVAHAEQAGAVRGDSSTQR